MAQRGDEPALFQQVARSAHGERVPYPGPHVHIASSLAVDGAVWVDTHRKATLFLRGIGGVRALVRQLRGTLQPVTHSAHAKRLDDSLVGTPITSC